MSDIAHVTSHLSEYLDNALATQEKRRVEKHLEQCKGCSTRYKELQQLRHRLKTTPELTPPESFYQSLLQRIEEDKKPFLIWDWPMTTKAVATFGVLMVAVMVAREARRSEPALFTPVSPAETQESPPVAAPTPTTQLGMPAPVSQPVSNTSPVSEQAPRAELPALEKKAIIENAKSIGSTDDSFALKQKTARKTMVTTNVVNADEEREKDVDRLAVAAQQRVAMGGARSALNFSGSAAGSIATASSPTMSVAAGNVALQARDINGPATQGSFAEGRQQLSDKKEVSAALSTDKFAAAPGQPTEWEGNSSAIASFRTVVITNDADWKTLWAEHTQNQTAPPLAPEVDFSRFIVVGVFAGTEHSNFEIKITEIKNGPDSITINYRWQRPAIWMGDDIMLNRTPYDIRVIPKTNLPITFIEIPLEAK